MVERILIVDDSPTQAAMLSFTLNKYIVITESNATSGLERAVSESFDLLILDLNLPDLSGLELCRRYKETTAQSCPVLIVTSQDYLEKIVADPCYGVDYFCSKDPQMVATRVALIFQQRRYLRRQQVSKVGNN